MNEFEDIEQLLKPQCEFKASDTLKHEVMEKARQELPPPSHRQDLALAGCCMRHRVRHDDTNASQTCNRRTTPCG
ncbi:MAG: hypothetical protein J5552_09665 [Prevotella sp.]|nr:hypothetical protein [Prevotella sp.]